MLILTYLQLDPFKGKISCPNNVFTNNALILQFCPNTKNVGDLSNLDFNFSIPG